MATLTPITTGSGTIGQLETTLLANGLYYVLLSATENTGKQMGSGVWLNVIGDYKPGRVSRTYDSLTRSTSSDFGYGWSLGIKVQMEIGNTQDVTLTLNGQRRTFYFTPPFNILGITTPAYTPEPGLFGKLEAPDSNCGSNLVT